MQAITLSNGAKMPLLGFGTWLSKLGEAGQSVKAALDASYRHIDCAALYGNEAEIGEVFGKAFGDNEGSQKLKRSDVFITSKLWNTRHTPVDVEGALRKTLSDLQIDALDLYLIHWPVAQKKDADGKIHIDFTVPYFETWRAMEKMVDLGLTKAIGCANINVQLLLEVLSYARIKPAVIQIECHPYLPQKQLISFCHAHNVAVTGYSPLGNPALPVEGVAVKLLDHPAVTTIASSLGPEVTPAQVLLKWNMQRQVIVIPKSINPVRITENFGAASLPDLTAAQMEQLSSLEDHVHGRVVDPSALWGIGLWG